MLSDVNMLNKVRALFEERKWSIDDGEKKDPSRFVRFCSTLNILSREEQELLIRHTYNFNDYNFDWIYIEMMNHIKDIISNIDSHDGVTIFPPIQVLNGVPVKANGNRVRPKSGNFLATCLEIKEEAIQLPNINPLNFPTNIESFLSYHMARPDSVMIIVDDYCGSGDTGFNFFSYVSEQMPGFLNKDKCFYLTPLAHDMGIDVMKKINITHLYTRKTSYSLSANEQYSSNIEEIKNLFMSMARKVLCKEDYLLGYKGCEDMISIMTRSPNNTLAIYWHETQKKIAPFPRQKILQ